MINPSLIIDAIVSFLQASPEVLKQLKHAPDNIYAYKDSPPKFSSLTRSIFQMASPGVMVAWMGSRPGPDGALAHDFSLYTRAHDAREAGQPTFSTLVTAIINAKSSESETTFLNQEFLPVTYAVAPTWGITRIHDEDGSLDLFELTITIPEKWENTGYLSE